jgi:hypothetical protein
MPKGVYGINDLGLEEWEQFTKYNDLGKLRSNFYLVICSQYAVLLS